MVKFCMLCPNPLEGDLLTEEHVIPNAIGGRKEVGGFICRPCNANGGRDWESALARELLLFSNFAGVKRHRGGEHPDVHTTSEDGTKWKVRADGTMVRREPFTTEQVVDGQTVVSIKTSDVRTAKNLVKRVTAQHAGSSDRVQVTEPRTVSRYNDQLMQFSVQFGGPQACRSIVKSALALLSEADPAFGIEREHCRSAVNYLLAQDAPRPLGNCFYSDLVVNRPTGRLFHCVSVVGQPEFRRILGYVEYFNCARFLIHVGDGYAGKPFQLTYAIDPVTAEQLEIEVDFKRAEDVMEATLLSRGEPIDASLAAASKAFGILFSIQQQRETNRVATKALQAMDLDSQPMTADRADQLSRQIVQSLEPYLEALVKNRRMPPPADDSNGNQG